MPDLAGEWLTDVDNNWKARPCILNYWVSRDNFRFDENIFQEQYQKIFTAQLKLALMSAFRERRSLFKEKHNGAYSVLAKNYRTAIQL